MSGVPPYLGAPDRMNKTERAYADVLYTQMLGGEILAYKFEAIKLRLGEGAWYTPDFLVVKPERFEIHEVKGKFFREAAKVRIKVAAETYPHFKFYVVRMDKPSRRLITHWHYEEIN